MKSKTESGGVNYFIKTRGHESQGQEESSTLVLLSQCDLFTHILENFTALDYEESKKLKCLL